MADPETELVGLGGMNRVWRVGDTIRRSRGPWSDTTAALLVHLERRGFTAAPRHLGVDDQGRDVLSALPGAPVAALRGDGQLEDVGHLLRELHRATADFIPPADSRWRTSLSTAGTGTQVIHRDVAPWNLLEVDGQLTGLVDWDLAGPGRPVEDLAYTAWHFVPLHGELMGDGGTGPAEVDRPRRLRVLCDAYGLDAAARASFLGESPGCRSVRPRRSASTPSTAIPPHRCSGTTAGSPRPPPAPSTGSVPTARSCRTRSSETAIAATAERGATALIAHGTVTDDHDISQLRAAEHPASVHVIRLSAGRAAFEHRIRRRHRGSLAQLPDQVIATTTMSVSHVVQHPMTGAP